MARTASERLRRKLVRDLRERGVVCSPLVAAAFAAVPRELFIGEVAAERGLQAVYRDEAIVTKRDPRGLPLSSSSQPSLMAKMLDLLEVQPGHRVLEIGAGTGYNMALLSHIVGPRPGGQHRRGRADREGRAPIIAECGLPGIDSRWGREAW
jgi:protein-L-isoaspartate(D-aspartate) O-methyltransferase